MSKKKGPPPNDDPAVEQAESNPLRDRAIRLFRYLSALAELRAKAVREVASYEATFWISELPREKECHTAAWEDVVVATEEDWLRIEKPIKPAVPITPAECSHWFDPQKLDDISTEPKLHDTIVDPKWLSREHSEDDHDESPPPRLLLQDHPGVSSAWEKYIETKWRPWTEQFRRWERVQKAYRKLFAIYQEQQRRGEQHELVLGVGTLVWQTARGHRVCRPIVTARSTIVMERESGCISVGPAADGANFALEQDMLEVDERPPIQDQHEVEKSIGSLDSHLDQQEVTPLLKGWLQTLPSAADTSYQDSLQCPERTSRTPQMAFAPILILRKRGAQSMREALKKIVKQLTTGATLPRGIAHICGSTDAYEQESRNSVGASSVPDEVLFPLPTNDEQVEIVHRLGNRPGVLVQGPPGTGKSHTIVNLLCHFLAAGKRVLVTSQTPRALQVLREKIEKLDKNKKDDHKILPLAVSLLGEDAESRANLEQSVQGILRQVNKANPVALSRQISSRTTERKSCLSRLSDLRRRLREIRESETTKFSIPGTSYEGTAQSIASALAREEQEHAWLEDQIDETMASPLTDAELKEIYSLWEQVKDAVSLRDCGLPDVGELPTVEELERLMQAWSQARQEAGRIANGAVDDSVRRLATLSAAQLQSLAQIGQQITQLSTWLSQRTDAWVGRARQEVACGLGVHWISLENATTRALESVALYAGKASETDLDFPAAMPRAQLLADAADLLKHLKQGKGLGFWVFRAPVVKRCKYLWHGSFFCGHSCNSPETLESLIGFLTALDTLDRISQEWANYTEPFQGTIRNRVVGLEVCRDTIRGIQQLNRQTSASLEVLKGAGETTNNGEAFNDPAWGERLVANTQAALAAVGESEAKSTLVSLLRRVAASRAVSNIHPALPSLFAAVERGNVANYRELLTKLASLHEERQRVDRFVSLDKRLRAVAPALADAIRSPDGRTAIGPHLFSYSAAWAHKRALSWLERFCAEHMDGDLAEELTLVEGQLRATTQEIVAMKAWKSCVEKLAANPMLQGALTAWQQTVKKIGKGTGKYAETHRRDARKFMQQCRNAIPVWIMPLYRVAEQVEIEPEVFDVVIVDEASQTGPEGLLLQYLGRQCIIVGDDKQISPEAGFIEGSQVRTLIEQHLSDVPFAETLEPGTSLFNQAAVRYGSRVTLCEHFRCMPEIIRFSNELCYADTPLIPLRQYPPARLPPLQVRFVNDGYREGKSQQVINRPEAAAVTLAVIGCLTDPRYAGKSLGVVCLQGHAQAQLIESMILDITGPEPFKDERRRLLCGDPYSFQGDERDIIFLSVVASLEGEGRSAPLTREGFRQRFNVAASRARDQMWLFHSIREGDLHPDCMRRRLIHYCYNPSANGSEDASASYESQFERDVAEELIRAGFRVIPQYECAGKRIDLVVEDSERRIAIECDGDTWHGPDQYDADMARQRMLERCGWKFLRLRGSVYFANRAKAIKQLISAITSHGIIPNTNWSDETTARDWIEEVSGNQCMEELGTTTVDGAEENVVQQDDATDDVDDVVEDTFPEVTPSADDTLVDQTPPSSAHFDAIVPIAAPSVQGRLFQAGTSDDEVAAILEVGAVESNTWFEIAHWAKANDHLLGWQRGLAYSLGVRKRRKVAPTPKQAKQGKRILADVQTLGFMPGETHLAKATPE